MSDHTSSDLLFFNWFCTDRNCCGRNINAALEFFLFIRHVTQETINISFVWSKYFRNNKGVPHSGVDGPIEDRLRTVSLCSPEFYEPDGGPSPSCSEHQYLSCLTAAETEWTPDLLFKYVNDGDTTSIIWMSGNSVVHLSPGVLVFFHPPPLVLTYANQQQGTLTGGTTGKTRLH